MRAGRRRVVVTGAAGAIGRATAPLLPASWDLVRTDVDPRPGLDALDVTDGPACERAFRGADAVVHLAADPRPDATWDDLAGPNVAGAVRVVEAAVAAGVRRLVLASSLHAVSAVPQVTQVRPGDPPRPGNLYGATKAWAEALGAWAGLTTATSVVALRIGYFSPQRPAPGTLDDTYRAAWLSVRDAAELLRAAVEADGVRFVVANGTSANRSLRADLTETVAALGYRPRDDAWDPASDT